MAREIRRRGRPRGRSSAEPRSSIGPRTAARVSLQFMFFAVVPLLSVVFALVSFSQQNRVALDFTTAYRQAHLVADGVSPYVSPDADVSDGSIGAWPIAAILPAVPLTVASPGRRDLDRYRPCDRRYRGDPPRTRRAGLEGRGVGAAVATDDRCVSDGECQRGPRPPCCSRVALPQSLARRGRHPRDQCGVQVLPLACRRVVRGHPSGDRGGNRDRSRRRLPPPRDPVHRRRRLHTARWKPQRHVRREVVHPVRAAGRAWAAG